MSRGWPKGQKRGPMPEAQKAKLRAANTKYPGAPWSRLNGRNGYRKHNIPGLRAIVLAAKERPCVDCKQTFPPCVMDFDHVRGAKLFELSMVKKVHRLTLARLSEEISKCDVVCANCHRIRTHSNNFSARSVAR